MSIVIARRDGSTERATPTPFRNEAEMQRALADLPGVIPIEEIEEGLSLLVIAREFKTESGPIDAVGIDQNGALYIIETKLHANTDKRRVVAQALDYGAALWAERETPDDTLDRLNHASNAEASGSGGIRARAADAFNLADGEVDDLVGRLREALAEGRFRFVVVMDHIDDGLRRLLSYVNHSSRLFDLFGVELDLYRLGDFDVVIPKLYGAETAAPAAASATRKREWTEAEFFPELARRHGRRVERMAREIYKWGQQTGRIEWRSGDTYGGFFVASASTVPQRLFKMSADGALIVYANHYNGTDSGTFGASPERWAMLRERLATAGLVLPETTNSGKTPYITLERADDAWMPLFVAAFDWVVAHLDAP